MKKLVLMAAFALCVGAASAQERTKATSKWKERSNGRSYEMEIETSNLNKATSDNINLSFKVEGDVEDLNGLSLVKKNQEPLALQLSKETQDLKVEPGIYTFKLQHKKLGEKVFVVELKKGDERTVLLSVK